MRTAAGVLFGWALFASTPAEAAIPAPPIMPSSGLPSVALDFTPLVEDDAFELAPCDLALATLSLDADAFFDPPLPEITPAWHTDRQGATVHYDQIGRRWDRPESYEAYRYPIARFPFGPLVGSGYDLDQPDEKQRRGTMRAIGHGGLDLPQIMGAPILMVPLAHQIGDARVVYVGTLFGNTVVTRHDVREGGTVGHYVVLYGHLSRPAPNLVVGQPVPEGALVGLVGDSESEGRVHLHLETRRVRDDFDVDRLGPNEVLTRTIVSDPRNVLPLASNEDQGAAAAAAACRERRLGYRRADTLGDFRLAL